MDRARWIAVACITSGAGLITVALGTLLTFDMRFERAALQLTQGAGDFDDSELDILWMDMVGGTVLVLLATGIPGSAMVAGSLLFALFQLPWLRPPPPPATDAAPQA